MNRLSVGLNAFLSAKTNLETAGQYLLEVINREAESIDNRLAQAEIDREWLKDQPLRSEKFVEMRNKLYPCQRVVGITAFYDYLTADKWHSAFKAFVHSAKADISDNVVDDALAEAGLSEKGDLINEQTV